MARLLFVEHHVPTRSICCRFLRARGHEVLEACNGQSALGVARRRKLDVLITDWCLPDMTTDQLLERLDQVHPIPVILFTNQPHLCTSAADNARIRGVIPKAADLGPLLKMIQEVCGGAKSPPHPDSQLRIHLADSGNAPPHFQFTETPSC